MKLNSLQRSCCVALCVRINSQACAAGILRSAATMQQPLISLLQADLAKVCGSFCALSIKQTMQYKLQRLQVSRKWKFMETKSGCPPVGAQRMKNGLPRVWAGQAMWQRAVLMQTCLGLL